MLSIFLLLQKNTTKLENLLLIGYSPFKVAMPYQILTLILNLLVLVLAIVSVYYLRTYYLEAVSMIFPQLPSNNLFPTIYIGMSLFAVVSTTNLILISKKVKAIWKHN